MPDPLQIHWPKTSEHLPEDTLIRLLNRYTPAGLITLHVDGGGSAIAAGGILYLPMPDFKGIITGWTLVGDDSGGSAVIDIWKNNYNTLPTVADTITAAAKPTLTTEQMNRALEVPTWTDVIINEHDILGFIVDSNSLNEKLALSLSIARGHR